MFILISIKVPGILEHIGTRVGGMIVRREESILAFTKTQSFK